MDNLKVQASQYWNGLSSRERQLVFVGGIALIIWLVFFGVMRPVMEAEHDARAQLSSSQSQLAEVEAIAGEILALRDAGVTSTGGAADQPLDTLISRSAALEKITLKGINQQNNSLLVRVEKTPFIKLMSWFRALETLGLSVDSLQVLRTDKPGVVEVQQLRISRMGDQR
ncbi:type II secretion system protein M [Sansalvadorimonas sp. 2012CJ34-2]|uniref:Type II secretion system protein M n=1 Tax=Parendozoicomonas callyspongiae TaxID=2942213 RepID=A0ABT0PDC4_9GAMM|nr:type II secretion system protein M [Sansalvadorimonas sp. 2012CJ34-2]MCL6268747.1 type II secretion system protein M [Sansalvadorimonas sp. 2012CJ34-2]